MGHPSHAYRQHVGSDQGYEHQWNQHDVPHQHLAEVHEIEERPHPYGVERILAAG